MNEHRAHDPQIEQIEDLPSQGVNAQDAEQVKGGFDPQPDPPCIGAPVFQPPVIRPPVFNPGGFVR